MKKPTTALTAHVDKTLRQILDGDPTPETLNNALRLLAKWRAKLIENTIESRDGRIIQHGPFKEMIYDVPASEGGGVPRLLGVYETTLAPIIEEMIAKAPSLIIDVGCAEGYYAIGLARRLPDTEIWARDASLAAQDKCKALAQHNDVEAQVKIGGLMTHADFDVCLTRRTVVICDIEGAEAELLDPDAAKGLLAADILVECHPNVRHDMVEILQDRFSKSHDIKRLDRDLDVSGLPEWMADSNDLDRLIALWEWRTTPTPWLWMTATSA